MREPESEHSARPPSLHNAEWLSRPETRAVFAALHADDVETRAVGGAVRNALLGQPVTEIDLATTASPEQVMELARQAGLKAVPTGIDHGTITIVADGVPFEVTTLRCDIETFGRRARVAFTQSWEEDARRRDFTLNAIYAGEDGTLFDSVGGLEDLAKGRVRFIGDAATRIREDYLRILRFFRFHAYYGKGALDEAGLDAAVKLRDGLGQLSAERIGSEVKRLLGAPGAVAAVRALYDYGLLTGLLGSVPLLSRFERLAEIESALDRAPAPVLRLGALAVSVEEDAARLGERFRLSNAERAMLALAAEAGRYHGLPEERVAKELLYRRGADAYRPAVLLAWADSEAGTLDQAWRDALSLPERWQAPAFPLRGTDIVALAGVEGPAVGECLRRLEQDWIAADFGLDREQLLAQARVLLSERRAAAD